ncbi:hypothetical protein LTR05_006132 [Lithohypha guttulata]|uniref:Pre-mRNA-processing factor 19 n=1 Tax=Lithohypha guttulata TaxID=1690604 RepID=A0AAN7YEQ8_9EURO|nr:hypothetical protein LTR05_006132 [Lithohypha guttulata]
MATVCSISGELPQQPVVSRKSGNVYEKRLIEAYISENGTEPTTGAPLTTEDLLDIQGAHTVRPRPPELTSIPALLGAFQQEWDALALEVFTLQQNLAQTRQELSTALYQNDAAVRVIARLTQERDTAREALRNINVAGPAAQSTNGDAMHVDSRPLPDAVQARIVSTQQELMKTRRKRPVPAEWATPDTISLFKPVRTVETSCSDPSFLSVRKSKSTAIIGSRHGGAYTISLADGTVSTVASNADAITAGTWVGSRIAIGTSSGKVKIIENGDEVASFGSHTGQVTGLSLHPSGEILASVSSDKTYAIYDLKQNQSVTQVQASSDGHLLATGGRNGQLQIFEVNSGSVGGVFELGAPATAICFSENGTWVATATKGSTAASIWDLRKTGAEGLIHTLEVGHDITSLDWDYTAQYLLIGGSAGITVKQYTKSTKLWSEPFKAPLSSVGLGWGDSAQSIISVDSQGLTTALSST